MSLWYRFCRSLVFALGRTLWGLRLEGRENVPATGPLLVTSNHISLLDPPILGCVFPREVGFVAKRELFEVRGLGALIRSLNAIPVDRARLTVTTLRALERFFSAEKALVYFPEGTRSKSGRLGNPKVGIGMVLDRFPVTIVPVHIEGTNSLLRCLFRRERMRVTVGRPYSLPREEGATSERRERYRRTAEAVMDRIRRLKERVPRADDRETGPPAGREDEAAMRGIADAGRSAPNTKEGMETSE